MKQRFAACKDTVINALRWNSSRAFASVSTGWIKAADGSLQQQTLGTKAVLGATYGFDGLKFLKLDQRAALTAVVRYTWDEPVLTSLASNAVQKKDTSLVVLRLTGGSDKFRILAEGSNAKDRDITPSQRAFKAAAGVDVRVYEALWINLRVGWQRTVTGNDTEVGSLLTISYSPTALLSGK